MDNPQPKILRWIKVQRLNVSGRNFRLRYSLVPFKYTEKWGVNDHEVKFNLSFVPANDCYITSTNGVPDSGVPVLGDASLWIDYVYLDTDERRQFAQVQHKIYVLKSK